MDIQAIPSRTPPSKGRPCPSVLMRAFHGRTSLASPEAQRIAQLVEGWIESGDELPTHYITINLLPDGPLADFKGTACGRRERLFGDLRRLFRKEDIAWRHIWIMERGSKRSRYFPHVNLLIWLPPNPIFRNQLWAFLLHRFKVQAPPGKTLWYVLNRRGAGHAVCARTISPGNPPNKKIGRTGLYGLLDYVVKEIDRNAFEPGIKQKLGDLVGASKDIVDLHAAAHFPRPRLRRIPCSKPPAPALIARVSLRLSRWSA